MPSTTILHILLFVVVIAWSVLNHFIYEWSNQAKSVAWFAAVDESVVQHLKMIFFPWLLVIVFDFVTRASQRNRVLGANLVSMMSSMWFITIVFAIAYYASGRNKDTSGEEPPWLLGFNIGTFLVGLIGGLLFRFVLYKNPTVTTNLLGGLTLLGMTWFFVYFSYSEDPKEGFWLDPHDHHHDKNPPTATPTGTPTATATPTPTGT